MIYLLLVSCILFLLGITLTILGSSAKADSSFLLGLTALLLIPVVFLVTRITG